MKKQYDTEFDELLGKALGNYEDVPSEQARKKIRASIYKHSNVGGLNKFIQDNGLFLSITVVVSIIATLVILYLTNIDNTVDTSMTQAIEIKKDKPAMNITEKVTRKEETQITSQNLIKQNKITEKKILNPTPAKEIKENLTKTPETEIKDQSAFVERTNTINSSSKIEKYLYSDVDESDLLAKRKESELELEKIIEIKEEISFKELILPGTEFENKSSEETAKIDNQTELKQKVNQSPKEIRKKTETVANITPENEITPDINNRESNALQTIQEEKVSIQEKTNIISDTLGKSDEFVQKNVKSEYINEPYFSIGFLCTREYLHNVMYNISNEDIASNRGYTFEVSLKYHNSGFFAESGIGISAYKKNISFIYYPKVDENFGKDISNIDTVGGGKIISTDRLPMFDFMNVYEGSDQNNYTFIQIPLTVGYEKTVKQITFSLKSGLMLALLINKTEPDIIQSNDVGIINVDDKTPLELKNNFLFTAGLGCEYHLSNKISFSLEFIPKYYLGTYYKDNGIEQRQPYSLGLRSGISIKF